MPKQITLPEYLKETGLKQMKIAELIGVTKETLSLYCRGNITPGVNVLRKIEEATGLVSIRNGRSEQSVCSSLPLVK